MSNLGFQLQVDPNAAKNYELVKPGWYPATVHEAEMKMTNAGNGQYVQVRYNLDNGRVVFGNFNVVNPNPKAEEIGRQQLNDLAVAIGITGVVHDTDQLINGRCEVKVSIKEAKDGYEAQNEVKGFRALKNSMAPRAQGFAQQPATQPAQQVAQQPAQQVAPTAKPPWAIG